MLEYDKIDISEGIDAKQSGSEKSKECSLCHFWYFIDKNFNYQNYLCDGCHDISMKVMSIKDVAIIYSDGKAYRVNLAYMSMTDATNLLRGSNLVDKKDLLYFFYNIKMVKKTIKIWQIMMSVKIKQTKRIQVRQIERMQ